MGCEDEEVSVPGRLKDTAHEFAKRRARRLPWQGEGKSEGKGRRLVTEEWERPDRHPRGPTGSTAEEPVPQQGSENPP